MYPFTSYIRLGHICTDGIRLLAVGLSVVGGLSAAVTFDQKIPMMNAWPDDVVVKTDEPDTGNNTVICDARLPVGQSITPQKSLHLSALWFPYKLTDVCPAGSLEIHVQEMPAGQPRRYEPAETPLLQVRNPVDLGATDGEMLLMKISFDGPDRIELRAGKIYLIEFNSSAVRLSFYRRGGDYYPSGTGYLNREILQFGQDRFRDIILAVADAASAEPVSVSAAATEPVAPAEPAPAELDNPIWPAKRWTEVGETAAF